MHTSGEGIETLDPMREPVFDEEIERAIGDRRLPTKAVGTKPVKHIVGAERLVRFEQDFKNAASDGRKAQATFPAHGLGMADDGAHAAIMIMHAERKRGVARPCPGALRGLRHRLFP